MGEAMSQVIVVDTDILIDAGRGANEAIACLQQLEEDACPALSVVTQMELMIGCRNKRESMALERFLTRFQILKLSESISDRAVTLLKLYRLSHGILIPDAPVAATAVHFDCFLITKNQRDYRFIEGLRLLGYPNPSMG
jgi:predicted nucleic acid-binding protein